MFRTRARENPPPHVGGYEARISAKPGGALESVRRFVWCVGWGLSEKVADEVGIAPWRRATGSCLARWDELRCNHEPGD